MQRFIRHLFFPRFVTRRRFPLPRLQAIEDAIGTAESHTSGEIRFVVETALPPSELWRGLGARERAQQVFADLRLWDTDARNGVLVYVLMADRDVELVADRGACGCIGQEDWEGICRIMEGHFRERRFVEGAIAGVETVGRLLARHFPGDRRDELPNQPTLL